MGEELVEMSILVPPTTNALVPVRAGIGEMENDSTFEGVTIQVDESSDSSTISFPSLLPCSQTYRIIELIEKDTPARGDKAMYPESLKLSAFRWIGDSECERFGEPMLGRVSLMVRVERSHSLVVHHPVVEVQLSWVL